MSIVDTKSNKIVGTPLLYWSDYANEKLTSMPANNTKFSVVIPDLGDKCTTAGACVSFSICVGDGKFEANDVGATMVVVWNWCKADLRVLP